MSARTQSTQRHASGVGLHGLAGLLLCASLATGCSDPAPSLAEVATERDFAAGVAVSVARLGTDALYAETVRTHFTSITAENAMKWKELSPREGEYDFIEADRFVEFAEANGLRTRGHALVWARFNGTPDWVSDAVDDAQNPDIRLRELLEAHIATLVGRYAGRIDTWDVVNEPLALLDGTLDQNLYASVLGPEYIGVAFRAARQADPDALLALNETVAVLRPDKFEGLLSLVRAQRAQGVPIDVVGLQGHLGYAALEDGGLPSQADYERIIDRLADEGVSVEFTEVDVPLWLFDGADTFAAQAEAYRALYTACASRAACLGVTVWGVEDSDTWIDTEAISQLLARGMAAEPLLFDAQLAPKPAYFAAVDAIGASRPSAP